MTIFLTNLLVAEPLPDALVVGPGRGVVEVLYLVHAEEGHLAQELVLPEQIKNLSHARQQVR
jgi:hypothetical protein